MRETAIAEYLLYRGHDAGKDEQFIGTFPTLSEAQNAAVPGHRNEWVRLTDGSWFHGGGNNPGESFTIYEVVA